MIDLTPNYCVLVSIFEFSVIGLLFPPNFLYTFKFVRYSLISFKALEL